MRLTVHLGEIFVYRALESLRASGEKGAWVEYVKETPPEPALERSFGLGGVPS